MQFAETEEAKIKLRMPILQEVIDYVMKDFQDYQSTDKYKQYDFFGNSLNFQSEKMVAKDFAALLSTPDALKPFRFYEDQLEEECVRHV